MPHPTIRDADVSVVTIRPTRGWQGIHFRELGEYRELLMFLAWRDIQIRYKQTTIGVFWIILQPLLTMLVFTLFFGRLGNIPSDGHPYAIFALIALVPWTFFAANMTQTANSIVDNAQLITKIYFPRLIVPIASVTSRLVDFVLVFAVLCLMLLIYDVEPTSKLIFVPVFAFLALITTLGVGLWLAAINVQYRDVRHVTPFLTQLWLFLTPVAYPSSMVPPQWRTLYGVNPMVGVIDGFRWSLLPGEAASWSMMIVSALVAVGILIGGVFYFRRVERTFADIV